MKIKKNEIVFFIAYMIFFVYKVIFENSAYKEMFPTDFRKIILYGSYGLFFIKILIDRRYQLKNFFIFAFLIFLSIIIAYISEVFFITELLLIIYAARNIEFKKIGLFTLIMLSVLVPFILISYRLGCIENYTFERADGTIRNSLGFVHVGKLSVFFMEMQFLYMYLKEESNKKVNYVMLIIIFIINFVIFKLTDVKNMFGLSILMSVLYILSVKKTWVKLDKKITYKILTYSYIIFFSITLFLSITYDSSNVLYREINNMMTGRLEITHTLIDKYGINLFGNDIVMYGSSAVKYGKIKMSEYSYIDSAYLQILLRYGMIFSALFGVSYIRLTKKMIRERKNTIVIWLFILTISSVFDDTLMNIAYNCVLICIFDSMKDIIYKDNNSNKIESNMEEKNEK